MDPITSYLELLLRAFEYDLRVFSEPWMYYPLLIPVTAYLAFFSVKWAVLTAPVWMPVRMIVGAFKSDEDEQAGKN